MAPKVEISDETISRLVKEHLAKESDEGGVKKHVRRHGMGYAKLSAAVVGLTVAINAYSVLEKENVELARKNLEISKENRVIFQAVATKVNALAERTAYVEGRLEGKKPQAAENAIKERIKPLKPKRRGGVGSTGAIPSKAKGKAMTKARPPEDDTVAVVAHMQMQMLPPAIEVDAYEQLPEDLEELIEIDEDMAQEQYQDEQ